jgi:hypothetical protein
MVHREGLPEGRLRMGVLVIRVRESGFTASFAVPQELVSGVGSGHAALYGD